MTDTMTVQRSVQRRGHVYEADVVRVLTFACVIAVHTISHTEPATSIPANGFEMLLHFTREAFFCLTGFVLLHQSLGRARPLPTLTFWRRRLLAVCVPYIPSQQRCSAIEAEPPLPATTTVPPFWRTAIRSSQAASTALASTVSIASRSARE